MSAESTIGHLRALWRTERIIADIRLKHLLGGLGLKALAALFAGCGLLLLELAAYFVLVQTWSAILAAAALGLFNLVLAAVLVMVASKRPPPRELALALEVEDSAVAALQGEARAFQANGFAAFRHPWEGALVTVLPRLIPLLIRAIRKSKAQPTDSDR